MANLLKIKEIAVDRKVTLKAIAEYLGITPTGLSKIIRENSTKTSTLERISEFLDVPVAVFFDENKTYSSIQLPSLEVMEEEGVYVNDFGCLLCAEKEKRIVDKEKQIADKDARIAELKECIANLNKQLGNETQRNTANSA